MEIIIKKFKELELKELYQILKIRAEVFVVEQNCPYLDPDDKDYFSEHLMIVEDKEIMAYARLVKPGVSYDESSIGRVLVGKKHRKKNLGKKLMEQAINHITTNWKEHKIRISAQAYLLKFYEEAGFKAISEEYLEDDIPHVEMLFEKCS